MFKFSKNKTIYALVSIKWKTFARKKLRKCCTSMVCITICAKPSLICIPFEILINVCWLPGIVRATLQKTRADTALTMAYSESFRKFQKASESLRKFQKVSEILRKSEKAQESLRKFQKVSETLESLRKFEKVSESLRKSQKTSESLRKFQKVSEILWKSQKVMRQSTTLL